MLTRFTSRFSMLAVLVLCGLIVLAELIGTGIRGETFIAFITRRGQTGWLQEMVVMDTSGGIIWRLKQAFPRYGALHWSPNGRWFGLVYREDASNTLRLMNTAGWQSRIAGREAYQVQWLPDSESLVYTSAGKLYRAYIDEEDPVELLHNLDGTAEKPLLSPDGSLLYFERSSRYTSDVYVMNLATQQTERLTAANGYNYPLKITNDGKKLAVFTDRNEQPEMLALDTATREVITLDALDWNDATFSTWSPDSTWLAYPGMDKNILIHNLETDEILELHYQRLLAGISWSPDSQWLAVIDLQRQVNLINVITGETRTLQDNISQHLAWSPDSSQLAIVTTPGHLILMTMATGDIQREEAVRILLPLQWTRAGDALLFEHDGDILLYNVETGNKHNLTAQYDGKFRPGAWRPG